MTTAEEMTNRVLAASLDKVIAALPGAVDTAMQRAVPEWYTPELADAITADVTARLSAPPTACPDGIAWCVGDPRTHTGEDIHRHEGPEHKLNGSYLQDPRTDGIATFHLAAWSDTGTRLVFQGSGLWPDLGLAEVDELKADVVLWAIALFATRRRFAIDLDPGRTAFTESEDEQTSSAAFSLATAAMQVALDKGEDRVVMLAAMRAWLKLTEAEARG